MLMDEPFSAVDPVVRNQLQDEFLRLQREIGKTIIMVTHDIDEALKLGDQVAVLRTGGTLAQIATPQELLARPADDFVADFIGRDRGYRILGFSEFDNGVALERNRRQSSAPARRPCARLPRIGGFLWPMLKTDRLAGQMSKASKIHCAKAISTSAERLPLKAAVCGMYWTLRSARRPAVA